MVKSCLLLLVLVFPVSVSGLAQKGDGPGTSRYGTRQAEVAEGNTFDVFFGVALNGTATPSNEIVNFTVRVHPDWAPLGAAQFKKLVEQGWYNDAGVFRVVKGFVAQFGLPAKPQPELQRIADDKVTHANTRGTLTFATSGPNSRTSQLFINYGNNHMLNNQGFAPFGEVLGDGMTVVDSFFRGYGERPSQGRVQNEGNAYLDHEFPQMTKFTKVSVKAAGESAGPEAGRKETKETQCLTAVGGTDCYKQVTWAREQGIKEHPGWYAGLTASSSREDFQAHLHGKTHALSLVCPMPCTRAAGSKDAVPLR